jgi:hypothetical protein
VNISNLIYLRIFLDSEVGKICSEYTIHFNTVGYSQEQKERRNISGNDRTQQELTILLAKKINHTEKCERDKPAPKIITTYHCIGLFFRCRPSEDLGVFIEVEFVSVKATTEVENTKRQKEAEKERKKNKRRESRKLLFELLEIDRDRLPEDPAAVASSFLHTPLPIGPCLYFCFRKQNHSAIKRVDLFLSFCTIKYLFCTKGKSM